MKKDIAVLLAVVLLIGGAFKFGLINIQSVEEYYSVHCDDVENADKTVFLTVDCSDVIQNYDMLEENLCDEKFVPSDGKIIPETEFVLLDGDSVFDILDRAARSQRIPLDYQGAGDNGYKTVYVKGINNLYEFSCGPSSGWTYTVNGESPDKGCSQYIPKDGDEIEFYYVCDYTKSNKSDVGEGGGRR
ncbi:DUF4430 domain-containing protein [Ruminococcus sp.]|uniref:DUF4430 domain-containing protein n=1 Tax=Ruminococcus sp. TaxID=41978 RepID=UPI0025CB89C4|nr:DUF4430 domain-containing protein [Ruminococcus sp.]